MSDMIINEVVRQLQTMPDDLQQEVLNFSRKLNSSTPIGIPGSKLLQFAGFIPQEDLEIMRQVIESDAEALNLATCRGK